MSRYVFRTNGAIPLDAFTTFGVNAKPKTSNPFGYFGTGLKYAVAVILRHGGKFRLFIDGVEYEFYTHRKDFRGKDFSTVRMRKRKRGMLSWMKSTQLPFTTELGKNWSLWQAYRELEANTRDEGGESYLIQPQDDDGWEYVPPARGTDILIESDGFAEAARGSTRDYDDVNVSSSVFIDTDSLTLIYEDDLVSMYEGASDHLYYQGVRVYDLRNPAKFTYNFKPGKVQLSEDRSAKNIWDMQYDLAHRMQRMQDEGLIEQILTVRKGLWFENDDLTFYSGGSDHFNQVAKVLNERKLIGRAGYRYYGGYQADLEAAKEDETTVSLTDAEWRKVVDALNATQDDDLQDIADKIENQAL